MRKLKTIQEPEKKCYYCYFFPFDQEFSTEMIKRCAENWLKAEDCPNWKPYNVYSYMKNRRKFKKVKMIKG